ncbi:MAG: hypothetical protein Q8R92_13690 [Deltaproteobacteria bacterium]|nr:hypothetical protein [Deltaproteobacteria bacterium]
MLVPINLTGGTYKHPSLPLSAQVTRNFWPQQIDNQSARSPYILESWPGLTLFGAGSGADGGQFEHNGILYHVCGTTLYTVAADGAHTSRGSILGSGPCIFDGIGQDVVIVRGGVAKVWDGTTLSTVSGVETPNSATHINNQMLYDGDEGRFCSSNVGDAATINALNYATAESSADDLLRVFSFNEQALLLGSKTIERWWNSGVGNPPFDRVQGGTIEIGLKAIYSVASNKDSVYLLGTDFRIYRMSEGGALAITDRAMSREFSDFSDASDAIGWCFTKDDQYFYQITFPTADKSFVYPEGGQWFEVSSGMSGCRSVANSYAYAFGKHLIGDYRNGNLYALDDDAFTENGETIRRVRDTGPLHGGLVRAPGKTLEMSRFELIMETGVGLVSGQGSDPVVMLSFSDDGGRTFCTETWGTVGQLGAYLWKVEWFALGSFMSRIIRIAITDPVKCSIHSAAADVDIGI